ncbi:hypothetical protein HNP36_000761 [Chryseobacterium shigense]|uniref:Uncharacterized protein n=1 Tax=Chryseobacterium shigense TaxID=297244 RepID=A0A841N853_9FLAO|nr:hypothetical protein [Chryseobacterium shigense]
MGIMDISKERLDKNIIVIVKSLGKFINLYR